MTFDAALESLQLEYKLTPRQTEVLRLMALGLRGPEIAERLGIEEKTVKNHRNQIYARMGIEHSGQAVAMILQKMDAGMKADLADYEGGMAV